MLSTLLRTATAGVSIIFAASAFAASDMPAKSGTPVTPSSSSKGANEPTGKTGSSDPAAAGTPVAPSKSTQPGNSADDNPAKGGKTN